MGNGLIHVLLVDDEPDFLETISYWLTSKGYRVSQARSGRAAVDMIRADGPDVVFLDIVMPDLDGLETLRRIRAINKRVPVILVTATMPDDNKFSGAKALGISGFFLKGSSLEQLSRVLQVALRMIPRSRGAASERPSGFGGGLLEAARRLFSRRPTLR